jgi:hypothetical protein
MFTVHGGFVPKSAQLEQIRKENAAFVADNGPGKASQKEFLDNLLAGINGVREWSPKEKLSEALALGEKVSKFTMKDNRLEGTDANYKALQAMLTPEELKQLQESGMPTDPAKAQEWLATDTGSLSLGNLLKTSGRAFSYADGTLLAAGQEVTERAGNALSNRALQQQSDIVTGDPSKRPRRGDESAEDYQKRVTEDLRNRLKDPTTTRTLLDAALKGGKDSDNWKNFDKIFNSTLATPEVKEKLGEQIGRQREWLEREDERYSEGLARIKETGGKFVDTDNTSLTADEIKARQKKLAQRRKGLDDISDKYLGGADRAINQKGPVTINAASVIINSKTPSKGS